MKFLRLLVLASFLLLQNTLTAQQYNIDGKTMTLTTEVEGPISLLYVVTDQYRYFIKKGEALIELKNTKVNRDYQEEYKETLAKATSQSISSLANVRFTLGQLRNYINAYNKKADPDFVSQDNGLKLKARLGGFVGYTNTGYFINPDNTFLPTFGLDLELIEPVKLKRHSVVIQFEQTIGNSDYDFNSSQLSMNYRFKFIKSDVIDVFINTKFAAYIHVSRDVTIPGENGGEGQEFKGSGGDLRAPGAFGLGADIVLGKGFVTVGLIDLVALGLDKGDEFPLNAFVGYKIGL